VPARRMLSVVVVVALVPAAGAAGHSLDADAQSGQAPTRESLAQVVKPPGAPGRTLGLSRVTIPPHTALAPHRHPGIYIVSSHHLIRVMRAQPEWNPRNAIDCIGDAMWVFRF